ncbi:Chromosome 2 open reading frame 81 [Pristimantis euphronides]
MPRVSVSKSRGDKSRTVTLAPLPQAIVDIIAGRFTEDDWLSMVVAEDGDDVVGDIVETLTDHVMEECLKIHLQNQVIPYTVSQARDALRQVVQWMFVPRDEGVDEPDNGRNQQEEPHPSPLDSWAQGCVPIIPATCTPRSNEHQVSPQHPVTDILEQGEEAPQTEEPSDAEKQPLLSSQEQICPIRAESEPTVPRVPKPIMQPTPPTAPPKTRPRYRPHRGPLRSAGLKNITTSLEETEKQMFLEQILNKGNIIEEKLDLLPTSLCNILKIQLGRPPQKKDVIYDAAGNVLSVSKVELSRLPRHHVFPQTEILNVSREAGRLRGSDTGRGGCTRRSRGATNMSYIGRSHGTSSLSDAPQLLLHAITTREEDLPGQVPVPSGILLDTLPLTNGVILRQGDRAERGSVYSLRQRWCYKEEPRELRPVQAAIPLPSLTVEQLLKNNVPQVQPLVSFLSHTANCPGTTTALGHRL